MSAEAIKNSTEISSSEINVWLKQKLEQVERECEVIRKAIALFEEAKNDISNGFYNKPKTQNVAYEGNVDNSLEVETVIKTMGLIKPKDEFETFSNDFVFKEKMTVVEFLDNLKEIRNHLQHKAVTVSAFLGIDISHFFRLEAKREYKLSKRLIQSLSNYYDIELIDIEENFKGKDGKFVEKIELEEKEMSLKEFSFALKDLRKSSNKTLADLATHIGLRNDAYWIFENKLTNGRKLTELTQSRLFKLAEFFNLKISKPEPISIEVKNQEEKIIQQETENKIEPISLADFFSNLKTYRLKSGEKQGELGALVGISNKGYFAFEDYCTKTPVDDIGQKYKNHAKIIANHFQIKVIDLNENNAFAGTVKTIISPTGKIKRQFTRNEILKISTKGTKIKRTYNKRETKSKPLDDSA